MSATGRSDVRLPLDAYGTPHWCTRRLLEAVQPPDGLWLDPCGGEGDLIVAARPFHESWAAVEIRPECREVLQSLTPKVWTGDFLALAKDHNFRHGLQPAAIITNPPFRIAQEFIEASMEMSSYVAMLLRVSYLESEERVDFLRTFPPDIYVIPNRPRFRHGINPKTGKKFSSDNAAYAWFVWPEGRTPREYGRISVLAGTPLEERRLRRGMAE